MKLRCTVCGQPKSVSDFYVDRHSPTGRHAACKECHKADVAARRARRMAEDPADFRRRCRAACRRYARTLKGKAAHLAAKRRWLESPKGKATLARYARRLAAAARRRRKGVAGR